MDSSSLVYLLYHLSFSFRTLSMSLLGIVMSCPGRMEKDEQLVSLT